MNDTFCIYSQSAVFEEWAIDVDLPFNTSSANYVLWILHSDSIDPFKGITYYVMIGGTRDELTLCRSVSGKPEVLIDGRDKTTEHANFGLKVTYLNFTWTLQQLHPDSTFTEGFFTDSSFNPSRGYTGLVIKQSTTSFHGKHHFDDFYCGPELVDSLPPYLDSFEVRRSDVSLFFNEWIKATELLNFELKGRGFPDSLSQYGNRVNLAFNGVSNGSYQLHISGVSDSLYHLMDTTIQLNFYYGKYPEAGDLIFNEILFDPYQGSVDFIEVCNISRVLLDLDSLYIYRMVEGEKRDLVYLPARLFAPGEYVVLSTDTSDIRANYSCGPAMLQSDIPPMNNDQGILVMMGRDGKYIDSMYYRDDMHFTFLNSTEGVSLERISLAGNSFEPDLWHSAASTSGYATPGLPNSQLDSFGTAHLKLVYDLISPNNDGYQDLLILRFSFTEPGYTLQARVFDLDGRLIDRPGNQITLSTNGIFTWDLMKTDATLMLPGTYILYFEAFTPQGELIRKKFVFEVI